MKVKNEHQSNGSRRNEHENVAIDFVGNSLLQVKRQNSEYFPGCSQDSWIFSSTEIQGYLPSDLCTGTTLVTNSIIT